jgi:hypothetical protein
MCYVDEGGDVATRAGGVAGLRVRVRVRAVRPGGSRARPGAPRRQDQMSAKKKIRATSVLVALTLKSLLTFTDV